MHIRGGQMKHSKFLCVAYSCELLSKLLVISPSITPKVVLYIIPLYKPPLRSIDYSSCGTCESPDHLRSSVRCCTDFWKPVSARRKNGQTAVCQGLDGPLGTV